MPGSARPANQRVAGGAGPGPARFGPGAEPAPGELRGRQEGSGEGQFGPGVPAQVRGPGRTGLCRKLTVVRTAHGLLDRVTWVASLMVKKTLFGQFSLARLASSRHQRLRSQLRSVMRAG